MLINVPANFTFDELMSTIRDADDISELDGYKSAREWAVIFDVNVARMRGLIAEGLEKDVVKRTRVSGRRIDNLRYQKTVYSFIVNGTGGPEEDASQESG